LRSNARSTTTPAPTAEATHCDPPTTAGPSATPPGPPRRPRESAVRVRRDRRRRHPDRRRHRNRHRIRHHPHRSSKEKAMTSPIERAAEALKARYEAVCSVRRADALAVFESIDPDDLAEVLHGDQCPEDPDPDETCRCDSNHYDRLALI